MAYPPTTFKFCPCVCPKANTCLHDLHSFGNMQSIYSNKMEFCTSPLKQPWNQWADVSQRRKQRYFSKVQSHLCLKKTSSTLFLYIHLIQIHRLQSIKIDNFNTTFNCNAFKSHHKNKLRFLFYVSDSVITNTQTENHVWHKID